MLKNHPRGIIVLFFTEMWERFGFYTLMAILVLYMNNELGWKDADKGTLYGIFLATCYFVPIFGGWLGDRLFGQTRTVTLGAICMALGYVAIGFSQTTRLLIFYVGLFLIAFGTGIFKVNMSVLVSNLYRDRPQLKDAGFNIFYMGVNVGAVLAPLAATAIGIFYESNLLVFWTADTQLLNGFGILTNYHICFWAAAVGMLLSLIVLKAGKKHLMHVDTNHEETKKWHAEREASVPRMSGSEVRARITILTTLFIIVIFFWVAFYQNGFALTLFAERSTVEYTYLRPETYQFFNPFFILLLTPLMLGWFRHLAAKGREPSTPAKIFIGMLVMGVSMLIMVVASLMGGNLDKNIMSPAWLISAYFVVTLAEILISPLGQSYVSKVSPPKIQGLMMGFWFSATALGSYGSGMLGKKYSTFAHHEYFLLLFGLLLFSCLLIFLSFRRLKRFAE